MLRKLSLGLAVLVLAGCEKTYTLQFKGQSVPNGAAPVILTYDRVAKSGEGNVGTVADGKILQTKLVVEENQLPGMVTWSAGSVGGTFPLSSTTASPFVITVNQQQPRSDAGSAAPSATGAGTTTETPKPAKATEVNVEVKTK